MDLLNRRRKKSGRHSEQKLEVSRPQEFGADLLSNHKITTLYGECVMQHDQATIRLLRERCKRALDLPFFFDWDWITSILNVSAAARTACKNIFA